MRVLRPIRSLLLAVGLAVLPVSAAMAMTHAVKAEISMGSPGEDCPCCNPAKTDACPLKCCHLQALTVEGFAPFNAAPADFGAHKAHLGIAVSLRPDPPPPRR